MTTGNFKPPRQEGTCRECHWFESWPGDSWPCTICNNREVRAMAHRDLQPADFCPTADFSCQHWQEKTVETAKESPK